MAPQDEGPKAAPGRRERQTAATRQRLLDAALAAFGWSGYQISTMDAIAEAADVSRATAFNYFPRKEDLVLGLLQQRRDFATATLHKDLARDADTATTLHDMMRSLASRYETDPVASRAFVKAVLQAGSALLPGYFETAKMFTLALCAGQRRGEIRADLDPDGAGLLLLDGYLGILYRWAAADPSNDRLGTRASDLVDLFLCGARATARLRRARPAATTKRTRVMPEAST